MKKTIIAVSAALVAGLTLCFCACGMEDGRVSDAVSEAGDKLREDASDLKDKLKDGVSEAGEKLKDGVTAASEAASKAGEAVGEAADKASEKLDEDGRVSENDTGGARD